MNRTFFVVIGTLAFGLSLLLLLEQLQPSSAKRSAIAGAQVLQIGALLCLTGECAEWGAGALSGMQLAAEELNAAGGVNGRLIELVVEDSREDNPAQAVSGFNYLRKQRGVKLIVGPSWTPAGLALAPIAAADPNVVLTSPSLGVAEFNETSENIFNLWPHDLESTRKIAQFALDSGYRRAAIFSSQQPYEKTQGDGFAEFFTKGGGTITALVEPLPTGVDLKPEALRIYNSNPEVIFFANFTSLAIAAKELRKIGYNGPALTMLVDQTRIAAADGALEGIIFTAYPDPRSDFVAKYLKRFGQEPPVAADTAYDAVYLYALAIEQVGSQDLQNISILELENLQQVWLALENYSGASGEIRFDRKGGVVKESLLKTVSGDRFIDFQG